jgi:sulfur carrier protein ThiS
MGGVKVLLRNPRREVEVAGPVGVLPLLNKLGYKREAVLVIVDGSLVTGDSTIAEGSEVEIRPVISGGAVETSPGSEPKSSSS